jgi:PAS domain-containing protein
MNNHNIRGNPGGAAGSSQRLDLSSVDPYALLGVGAVLALMDREEDIACVTAGALTEALSVPLGALVLRNQTEGGVRVFGQYAQAPLEDVLAEEIRNLLSSSDSRQNSLVSEPSREIEVQDDRFPEANASGLRRLMLAGLRTIEDDFGVMMVGAKSDEPFLFEQRAAMEALASQASVALHHLKLTKERETREAALRESEERFRKIFDRSNDAIFVLNPAQDEMLDVNSKACNMLGFSREELLSTPISYHLRI